MPLLKRKDFERAKPPEMLRDEETVFYCAATKEVFRNYEDYFERVMLTSSMVWTCSFTGKPNLTYAEAVESENEAKSVLRHFPKAIRGPMMLVTAQTKRSALSELVDDVFSYIKDRFFVGERIDVLFGSKYRCCDIVEVIKPTNTTSSSPIKHERLRYKVEAVDEKQPKEWVAMPENIKRDKAVFSKDKVKLFLKQHIESSNNMLRVKDSTFQKYVTDQNLEFGDVFAGKAPDFQLSKRLVDLQKRVSGEPKKKKTSEKQPSIQKYLNKSADGGTKPKMTEKQRKEAAAKLQEEMERVKREKEEREAQRKKRVEEEKAELNAQINQAIRDLNQVREDLELSDQRMLPKPQKIEPLIGEKRFGPFLQILEFLHTFAELLSIKDKFSHGVTMSVLERALILREPNGPLTDILQVLLSTIFSLQNEEANEVPVSFETNIDVSTRRADTERSRDASRAGLWCEKHYSTHLSDLPMDAHTISELLRLHFLSSGALVNGQASNWRYWHRGGYVSYDDPGFRFCVDQQHIVRLLGRYSVYQLSQSDIIKVIRCLMDQILTYSSVRELIEERLEKAQKAKFAYRQACAVERRREDQLIREKRELREEVRKVLKEFKGSKAESDALKAKKEAEMETKFLHWDRTSEIEKQKFLKETQKCKMQFFDYQVFLGSDRAGRNYFIFESIPGLFVEHDTTFAGKCFETTTANNPGLANCPAAERNKFIRQMVIDRKNNDKENKADNGLKTNGIVKDKTPKSLSQTELMMCTANPITCPVHALTHPDRVTWSFFHTEEEINSLIAGLNPRGFREKTLRESIDLERELILDHIRDCPVEKLVVEDGEQAKRNLVVDSSKKYPFPNFEFEAEVDLNSVLDTKLREELLDFEFKLKAGYLGNVRVADREAWRAALENHGYDQQVEELTWGHDKKLHQSKSLSNGHGTENGDGKRESDEEDEKNGSKESMEVDETESRYGVVKYDPGYNLLDNAYLDSSDSQDDTPMHDSQTLREKVKSLASALLQVEQGIDPKFLQQPFGQKRDKKNQKLEIIKQRKLERWEESLMRSTSYSQISLHLNVLHDAVCWSRSAARQLCSVCRRAKDPEYTLLCDECNRGYHTYCLKPKLKDIPEGDWFCPKCRPEDYVVKRSRRRRIFTEVEEEDLQTAEEEPPESRRSSIDEGRPQRKSARRTKEEFDSQDEQPLVPASRKRSSRVSPKKRESWRHLLDSDNDTDNEPLAKTRRSSRRRSVDSDADNEPLARRSRRHSSDENDTSKRRGSRRGVPNDDENLTLHASTLYSLLEDIAKHRSSWPFNRPVSMKEVPDYYDIIKTPMDFAKIKSQLNTGIYTTDYDLMSDVQLVFKNCDLYNNADSEIYKAGIELERFVQKKCKEYKIPFRPSDMLQDGGAQDSDSTAKRSKKRTTT